MKTVQLNTALVVSTIIVLAVNRCQAEIVEESGSLLEFFAGHEENCAYDNWVSHISEGIARAGYNEYCPVELDRQTNGFGDYQILDSLQNSEAILQDWYRIFANILAGNLDDASAILDSSDFADLFDLVVLEDQDRRYIIVREVLDGRYFDDNGTEDQADDVEGSFRYGWGIYIFNPEPTTPELILELPHPNDDYITPYIGIDAFISSGASAMFVAGAGREVKWTQVGDYDNSKSRSDPTRVINRSVFQQAHRAVVDSIADEFVLPIHSYDSRNRDLAQCLLSTYPDADPSPPIIDRVNRYDFLHLTPLYPVAANSIGNADHNAVRIDEFYAIWNDGAQIFYNNEYPISNTMPNLQGWLSPQRSYSSDRRDTLRNIENYMHIEHDEFPDVITEAILDFYPADGVPTYATFANAVEFYRPLYHAIYSYYNRTRFFTVPGDYDRIQAAIDGSLGGDTIMVQPGVYAESINYHRKNLLITSNFLATRNAHDIDSTIIAGREGSVVTFEGGESELAKIVGFTIRGGRSVDGAGIYMTDARPVIDHCIVTDNEAEGYGGGMFCDNSMPTIINCTFSRNRGLDGGGAIFGWNTSHPIIINSIITRNEPQDISFFRLGPANGISCGWSDIEGGAEEIETGNNAQIIWGEGNIDENPNFIDPDAGNFHLSPLSPCVNAGNPESPLDPDSTRADMGALPIRFRNVVVLPEIIEFSEYQIGVPDSIHLRIHNAGIDTISILSRRITPDNTPFSLGGNNEIVTLEPDSDFIVWVLFAPVDSGEHRATLLIVSDVPGEEITRVNIRASLLGVGENKNSLLGDFRLLGVYPNPFNAIVTIRYSLPQESQVNLSIYDLSGREVVVFDAGRATAGVNNFVWSAETIGSGLYFLRLQAGNRAITRKITVIR